MSMQLSIVGSSSCKTQWRCAIDSLYSARQNTASPLIIIHHICCEYWLKSWNSKSFPKAANLSCPCLNLPCSSPPHFVFFNCSHGSTCTPHEFYLASLAASSRFIVFTHCSHTYTTSMSITFCNRHSTPYLLFITKIFYTILNPKSQDTSTVNCTSRQP